jgi:hypothetical protein
MIAIYYQQFITEENHAKTINFRSFKSGTTMSSMQTRSAEIGKREWTQTPALHKVRL